MERKSGHFVVTSSVSGKFGVPLSSGYCATKHALVILDPTDFLPSLVPLCRSLIMDTGNDDSTLHSMASLALLNLRWVIKISL
jgi:hypothetical protein